MESTSPSDPITGVSNPPDGGAVTSVDTPQDQEQTPQASSQASQGPQPQGPAASAQLPQTAQDGQQPQTQNDNSADQVRVPNQGKPLATAAVPDKDHPSVQRASILHTIAQALAGGPRYTESIDVNTGEMKRQQVPLSRADIGLAIAMEAISGSLTGLAQQGPGATGRAAAAGFQQGENQVKQAQQKQDEQATADFARHYQVLETNMRLHQNAMTLGRQDYDMNQAYVGAFKDLATMIQKEHQDVVKGVVSESDLSKFHVTKDSAIPYGVVKRIDPKTGQQVTDQYGQPQWDVQYMVVDPNFTADNLLTDKDRAAAKKYNIPGLSASNLPQSFAMKLSMALNYKARIAALELADQHLQSYRDTINDAGKGGEAPTQTPELKNQDWNDLADKGAKDAGISNALVRAVIQAEDGGGDPKAVNPKSGATGPAQFMPATAKRYGVTDPTDPSQAIPAAAHYLSDLVKQYHGDIKTALAAYNGAAHPEDPSSWKPETQKYVADITKAIGLQAQQPTDQPDQPKDVNLADAIKKDPSLVNAVQLFQGMLNKTEGNMGKALALLQDSDPNAAGKIQELYGNRDQMVKYDQQKMVQADRIKRQEQNEEAIDKYRTEQHIKQEVDQQAESDMQASLRPPENFKRPDNITDMSADDLESNLRQQGVTVPDGFPGLYAIAHYDAPLTTAAARIWAKGAPHEMDQQTMLSYIRRFINPNFKSGDFQVRQNAKKNMYDETREGGGKTIVQAGVAAQHVQMFLEAGKALQNGDITALNHIAQTLNVQTGKDKAVVFDAIAHAASDEVTKVLTGQAPYQEQVIANRDLVSKDHSYSQIQGVAKAWTHLMYARIKNLDEYAHQTWGEHLGNVTSDATQLFQGYGYQTPWSQKSSVSPENQPGMKVQVNDVKWVNGQQVTVVSIDPKTGKATVKPVQQQQQPQQPQISNAPTPQFVGG